jgi:hypothetical protein
VRDQDRVSRLLFFPSRAGRWFCGVLVRSGGFSLLDAAYRSPPKTTEQVLHPEKYLTGENAVPVAAPEPEVGGTVVASGHLGEFVLRTMLLACNGFAEAKRAAEGWGGDAFTLATRRGNTQLRLVTTWDCEADALEFESALRRTAACWDGGERFQREYDGPTGVVRDGNDVVLVRGARDAFRDIDRGIGLEPELARPLLDLVGHPLPSAPPLGHVALRLPPPPPRVEADVRDGDSVVSTRFGIEIPVPKDWDAKLGMDIRLGIVDGLPPAIRVALVWRTFDAESVAAIIEDRSSGVSAGLEALEPGHEEARFVKRIRTRNTRFGRGFEVDFAFHHHRRGGGHFREVPDRLRAIIVPVCDGAGALVLTESWATPADESQLDDVLAGIRPLAAGPALCPAL